ncbi:MAG: ABC transporter permease [Eubacteriales bacterium]|jgi:oligopeptide transport system permease protein|nr:ABC transporter permease [Eubacteriales bacterium]MDY2982097.1 ABC transporter permease [Eubacteriales bacterium]
MKYFFKRLLRGLFSVVVAMCIIIILLFFVLDKTLIFAEDEQYVKLSNNQKITYMYTMWEKYGYLTRVTYNDYLNGLVDAGEITEEEKSAVATIGRTAEKDSDEVRKYVDQFTKLYESKGYTICRLDAVMANKSRIATGGGQTLFAYLNTPVLKRLGSFFSGLLTFDNIHYVQEDIGERKLTFTFYDPVYGGEKFSPAIIGNGTYHKYLLYCNDQFPYIHQNFVKLRLGTSFTVNKGIDAFETMTQSQGTYVVHTNYYPTGLVAESADDLHTATYMAGSRELNLVYADQFDDDYTNTNLVKDSRSKIYYSFIISILGSLFTYLIGLPLGILMAKKKDTWVDNLGNAYVIFMIAVPSLAYYFMFKAFAINIGLPVIFSLDNPSALMYVTPVLASLAASVAGTMKWMRRYMVDQMNSDYVKFARAGGLTEGEIFTKHIFKNAAIPTVHGIPNTIIMALSGSIMMERIYAIPGVGGLLIQAIGAYDNAVILGVAFFYGTLSIIGSILGDILMSVIDPRISYTSKAR